MLFPLRLIGKSVSGISRLLRRGYGGTWPGEVVLRVSSQALSIFIAQVQEAVILVAGTNGKTTTSLMIRTILLDSKTCTDDELVHNASGANLVNGLISAFLHKAPWLGKPRYRYAILEVDENVLPLVADQIRRAREGQPTPRIIVVLLNLFRDQLDRYGEVDSIARKWKEALRLLPADTTVIANADDPSIVSVAQHAQGTVVYTGINKPDLFHHTNQHTADASYCPVCGEKLVFEGVYFSHLGQWHCASCDFRRPKLDIENVLSPLPGLYNEYNTLGAVGTAEALHLSPAQIRQSLQTVTPAFGRQESLVVGDKAVKIFLSKNPAGFDASLQTVLEAKPQALLFVLNDRIPDGRDVSWIWDTNLESIPADVHCLASGDRAYDMGIRLKYARSSGKGKGEREKGYVSVFPSLEEAIQQGLQVLKKGETLYVLATYSAMLEVRKLLTGRKIL